MYWSAVTRKHRKHNKWINTFIQPQKIIQFPWVQFIGSSTRTPVDSNAEASS